MKKHCSWFLVCLLTVTGILALSYWGSRAVSVIAENLPPERQTVILIDPGHGGVDGGAVSCTGIPESRYNLDISLRLYDLFRFLGYDARMIRKTDTSVHTTGETIAQKKLSDLKERVRITNETDNAVLISIHQNFFSDSRYSGAQVFYASTEGSRELAQSLQSAFSSTVNPGSRRQCRKSDGVYLMERIRKPGVLIECGFLSSPREEAMLRDPAYQKQLCCVIASTVDTFLRNG